MKENLENIVSDNNCSQNLQCDYSQLKIQKKFASGLTSDIYLALDEFNNQVVIKLFNEESLPNYLKEIHFFEKANNSSNLIKSYGHGHITSRNDKFCNHYYIIMEYAEKGDLYSQIIEKERYEEPEAKLVFLQLINCVEDVHNQGFIHRDIKPENFLICNEKKIKLTDFGFCEEIGNVSKDENGTPGYIPPEVLEKTTIIPKEIDVFSLGVIAFILVSGELPFEDPTKEDPFYCFIHEDKWESYWESVNCQNLSKEFKEMFEGMVCKDPSKRLTIDQIKNSAWMSNICELL